MTNSIAHRGDLGLFGHHYPDGTVPWDDATPPDVMAGRTTGRLRGCGYCGSMHPADLVAALNAGATLDPADRKYGWPHKFYVNKVPNPHAGMPESRSSTSHPKQEEIDAGKWIEIPDGFDRITGKPVTRWTEAPKPAAGTTWGKFYTLHLMDASPEDKDAIERAVGMRINFTDDGKVGWAPYRD